MRKLILVFNIFFITLTIPCCFSIDVDEDPTGACVSFFGGCVENIKSSECGPSDGFWRERTCDEVDPFGACKWEGPGYCKITRKSECNYPDFYPNSTCN